MARKWPKPLCCCKKWHSYSSFRTKQIPPPNNENWPKITFAIADRVFLFRSIECFRFFWSKIKTRRFTNAEKRAKRENRTKIASFRISLWFWIDFDYFAMSSFLYCPDQILSAPAGFRELTKTLNILICALNTMECRGFHDKLAKCAIDRLYSI